MKSAHAPAAQSVSPAVSAAASFRVRTVSHGGIAALELCDAQGGARAVFALRGATLLDWQVEEGGQWLALTDGYRTATELADQNGVRNGLLAPFPNRIADARYRFDGREHDLRPGIAGERLIYHGFLRTLPLTLLAAEANEERATISLAGRIGVDDFPGYPFALALALRVDFTGHGIALTLNATNVGDRAAPYAAGWHPYFRLGDAPLDALELTVPATHTIVTDRKLLPPDGEAAFLPVEHSPLTDFRAPRQLGALVLDGCYAGATADEDGLIRSTLRDPASGRQLTVWQRGGLVHLFTGDTLARDPRRALAIEPVEAMTDAFNRPDCAEAIRLAPGATRSFACGVEFSPGDAAPLCPTPTAHP